MRGNIIKGSALHDAAVLEDDDSISESECIEWVVSDEECCHWSFTSEPEEVATDLGFGTDIKCGCWFIKKKDGRFSGQCSCERDSL